jgi:membrane-bound ClpP family serine protease
MFFNVYTILLMLSGVLLIVVGASVPGQGTWMRILNILVGAAFLGYGFYLQFLFEGDSYRIFLYAFIGPILLIARTVQARQANRQAVAAAAAQQARVDQEMAARQGYQSAPPMQPAQEG